MLRKLNKHYIYHLVNIKVFTNYAINIITKHMRSVKIFIILNQIPFIIEKGCFSASGSRLQKNMGTLTTISQRLQIFFIRLALISSTFNIFFPDRCQHPFASAHFYSSTPSEVTKTFCTLIIKYLFQIKNHLAIKQG